MPGRNPSWPRSLRSEIKNFVISPIVCTWVQLSPSLLSVLHFWWGSVSVSSNVRIPKSWTTISYSLWKYHDYALYFIPFEQLVSSTPNEREIIVSNRLLFVLLSALLARNLHRFVRTFPAKINDKWIWHQMHHVRRELAHARWKSRRVLAVISFSFDVGETNCSQGMYVYVFHYSVFGIHNGTR